MAKQNLVEAFVTQIINNSDYDELDRIYLRNHVLGIVGDEALEVETTKSDLIDLKDELVRVGQVNGKFASSLTESDIRAAELMSLIVPRPSVVNRRFWQTYQESPVKAIKAFYELSKRSDYIKTRAIAKNIYFISPSKYGNLEITINLAKPEKDPKKIAAATRSMSVSYPQCQLCMENEGYLGRSDYPARMNHRIIRFELNHQTWGLQYSPYAYFNEHCIFLYSKHEQMKITRTTFSNLLAIVEKFPGYFVGSNADLPIVGGSILTHEHYQGGRHCFPMDKAPLSTKLQFANFNEVEAGIVKWPMSVIRLRSQDKSQLVDLAAKILANWQKYSDETVNVRAVTNGIPHHTLTPIARRQGDAYVLDLVLRDNQTSATYPDGIFHPHPDVQHIKKENIGLIEVMGLAILPPRLKREMLEVKKFLLGQPNKLVQSHSQWAKHIKAEHQITADNVDLILKNELGHVFVRVLEDAGVFKQTQSGQAAFMRFVQQVGLA